MYIHVFGQHACTFMYVAYRQASADSCSNGYRSIVMISQQSICAYSIKYAHLQRLLPQQSEHRVRPAAKRLDCNIEDLIQLPTSKQSTTEDGE